MGSDDGVAEPLEPTIQDRLPDFSSLGDENPGETTDADDTEVMKRRAPVPPARQPSSSSTATTDVIDRDALLAQRRGARPSKPRVPRPTPGKRRVKPLPTPPKEVSDDDPTTLYDIDAARAKLRARRRAARRGKRSDDGFPEDGDG